MSSTLGSKSCTAGQRVHHNITRLCCARVAMQKRIEGLPQSLGTVQPGVHPGSSASQGTSIKRPCTTAGQREEDARVQHGGSYQGYRLLCNLPHSAAARPDNAAEARFCCLPAVVAGAGRLHAPGPDWHQQLEAAAVSGRPQEVPSMSARLHLTKSTAQHSRPAARRAAARTRPTAVEEAARCPLPATALLVSCELRGLP